ncbi:Protein FAM8A1 [Merluccius polli]|uniref:Protein FAM8A1 n=1 Tax=Merluccius polli TaxID=89951 RepID=A0AA47MB85_MERPO|nr:Protein FAM8A1 [Merluccius polli]
MAAATTSDGESDASKTAEKKPTTTTTTPTVTATATTEYCAKLQQWMWRYYWGQASWQSWVSASAFLPPAAYLPPPHLLLAGVAAPPQPPPPQRTYDAPNPNWYNHPYPFSYPVPPPYLSGARGEQPGDDAPGRPVLQQQQQQQPQAGREYTIPTPVQRFLAETVDFFILFCVKATIVLWIMHLSGMKDIAKFITQFIVEEIDENTSLEDLQKMMAVALVYRVLVCIYEIICIWGAGGATPGKFLLGLRVVTCDTSTLVRPNRVLVVPASNVSLSASTVRALNKNFSIAFLFPIFITLFFFQHNRTVYDIVAGTIVVQRRGAR